MNSTGSDYRSCAELRRQLIREKSLLESINQTLNHQQDAVLGNDIPTLNDTVSKLRQLLNSFAAVEQERREAMEELARVTGAPLEEITLQKLLDALVVPEKEALLALGEEVRALLLQVEKTRHSRSFSAQDFPRRKLEATWGSPY